MNVRRYGWAAAGRAAVAIFAAAQEADAGGGAVRLARTTLQESSGVWHLAFTIDLPAPPSIAYPTFRFSFTPTVVYERSLVDGDKIVVNKQPVSNAVPKVETSEVGFADLSGKIWKTTKFTIDLNRPNGYQAGEYKLVVTGPNGSIGQPINLTLEGDNPAVDRRTMDFSKKKDATPIWDGGAESGIKSL